MDIFEKCANFTEARMAIAAGFYPYFIPLSESEGAEATYQDHRLIMCGSNNYLGLTTHPKVRQAAKDAIDRFGTSCTGSRFLNGTIEMHEQLERELAEWVGKESALVFSTGMQVNLGTISASWVAGTLPSSTKMITPALWTAPGSVGERPGAIVTMTCLIWSAFSPVSPMIRVSWSS